MSIKPQSERIPPSSLNADDSGICDWEKLPSECAGMILEVMQQIDKALRFIEAKSIAQMKEVLWMSYCEKKLIFVRHFPYQENEAYAQYLKDLHVLLSGNSSLGERVKEQDIALEVKKLSELSLKEDVYTPIFQNNKAVRVFFDSDWKTRNLQTVEEIKKAFPNGIISPIRLRGIDKSEPYRDELLNAATEIYDLIYSEAPQHDENTFLVISNSSYAPVLRMTEQKFRFDVKEECRKFVAEGLTCVDLNGEGKMAERKWTLSVTPKNYAALSGLFNSKGFSYVELQNSVNLFLHTAKTDALAELIPVCGWTSELLTAIFFQFMKRDPMYLMGWEIMQSRLPIECIEAALVHDNQHIRDAALHNIFFLYPETVKSLANSNPQIPHIVNQLWQIDKIKAIMSRSVDEGILNAKVFDLPDLLSDAKLKIVPKDGSAHLEQKIPEFIISTLDSHDKYLIIGPLWSWKTTFSAWLASLSIWLYPERSVYLFEGSDFASMTLPESVTALTKISKIENVLLIVDGLGEIHASKRQAIKDCLWNLDCLVIMTSRPNEFSSIGWKAWNVARPESLNPYHFFLARAENYDLYASWIQEYNRLESGFNEDVNPLFLGLFLKILKHGDALHSLGARYEVYETFLKLVVEEYLLGRRPNLSRLKPHYIKNRIESWHKRLSDYAHHRFIAKNLWTTVDIGEFEDILELDHVFQLFDSDEILFAHKSFEEFFLATHFLWSNEPLAAVASFQKDCHQNWQMWLDFLPSLRFILSGCVAAFGPKETLGKVIQSWLIENDADSLETLCLCANFFLRFPDSIPLIQSIINGKCMQVYERSPNGITLETFFSIASLEIEAMHLIDINVIDLLVPSLMWRLERECVEMPDFPSHIGASDWNDVKSLIDNLEKTIVTLRMFSHDSVHWKEWNRQAIKIIESSDAKNFDKKSLIKITGYYDESHPDFKMKSYLVSALNGNKEALKAWAQGFNSLNQSRYVPSGELESILLKFFSKEQ